MKKIFSVIFCMLFLFSFVAAKAPVQTNVNINTGMQIFYPTSEYLEKDADFDFHIHPINISDGKALGILVDYCYLHIYQTNGTHLLEANMSLANNSVDWHLLIDGGNFSKVGEYPFRLYCQNTFGGSVSGSLSVNYLGEAPPTGFDGRFILLLCFVLLFVGLAYLQKEINFNKWYQGILSKYNNRNFFRTFISKLGFFFMNNPFSLFYMIGLFIMLLMYDVTRVYVLESAYNVMEVLVMIYLFAMFFLFIELLGDIHEFFSKIAEDIKAMGWGMSGDSGLLDTNKIGGGK